MTQDLKVAVTNEFGPSRGAAVQPTSVVTRTSFAALPMQVWRGLKFYEELDERPPLHLRVVLPVPIRTEGRASEVGAEAKCVYESGYLLKRVTRIERGHIYEFNVVEQELSVGGAMRLSGGRYTLRELPGGRTEVAVETHYVSSRWPRWFWERLESLVCHSFHHFLLGAMRRKIESP